MGNALAALYVLTEQGASQARALLGHIHADVYILRRLVKPVGPEVFADAERVVPFDSLSAAVAEGFHAHRCHIFFTASGIAVRAIAPLLVSKDKDPAVLVVDPHSRYVVSLLSGHLGGANEYARQVAALLGAQPVITTATDAYGVPSVDLLAQRAGFCMDDLGAAKRVNAALVQGEPVFLYDPENRLTAEESGLDRFFTPVPGLSFCEEPEATGVAVTHLARPEAAHTVCFLHPPVLHVGVGCKRGVSGSDVLCATEQCFAAAGLALPSICALASVDIKAGEPGIREAAAHFSVPFVVYTAEELSAFPVSVKSQRVLQLLGIPGVCEAAAQASAASRGRGTLIVQKQVYGNVTVAVARQLF